MFSLCYYSHRFSMVRVTCRLGVSGGSGPSVHRNLQCRSRPGRSRSESGLVLCQKVRRRPQYDLDIRVAHHLVISIISPGLFLAVSVRSGLQPDNPHPPSTNSSWVRLEGLILTTAIAFRTERNRIFPFCSFVPHRVHLVTQETLVVNLRYTRIASV